MVLSNYDRAYSLIVGQPPKYIDVATNKPVDRRYIEAVNRNRIDFRSEKDAVEITTLNNPRPLNIQAKVSGSSNTQGSDPVKAEIRIYNLSEDRRAIVARKNNFVIFKAGYRIQELENTLPSIFIGQVESSFTEREGSDIVTTLICKDGYTPSNTVRISVSLSEFVYQSFSYEDVLNELVRIWKDNGIDSSNETIKLVRGLPYNKLPSEILIQGSWSYEGNLRDAMNEVCDSIGYTWQILSNILYIFPKTFKKFTAKVPLNNRLIKSIRTQQDSVRSTSTDKEEVGIQLRTFLNGSISLAKVVEITEGQFEGSYNPKEIVHNLDYRGNFWDTDMLCEKI